MRLPVLLGVLVSMALAVGACGDDDEGGAASGDAGGETPTVRMQALAGGVGPLVLKAIETEGLDEKHGFKGEYLYVDPSAASQTFLQGETDVSFDSDPLGMAVAQGAGHKATAFLPILNNVSNIMVKNDSSYQTPEDLKGKKVGHFGADSGTTSIMAALLARDFGIDVFKDYELVEAGPPALVELLKDGEVDAIFSFTPHAERAMVEADAREIYIATAQDQEGAVPGLVYAAAFDDWLNENEELAKDIEAAAKEAMALFIDSDFELMREEPYTSMIDMSDETLDKVIERSNEIPLMFEGTWDTETAAENDAFVKAMGEQGILIEEPPSEPTAQPLSDFFDG